MNPPEFILTTHAKERLALRLKTKPFKFLKVARKAWNSKPIQRRYIKNLEYQRQFRLDGSTVAYRELMGHVFVFDVVRHITGFEQKKLITLYV